VQQVKVAIDGVLVDAVWHANRTQQPIRMMIPNATLRTAQIRQQACPEFALKVDSEVKFPFAKSANNLPHFAGVLIFRLSIERNHFVEMRVLREQIGRLLRDEHGYPSLWEMLPHRTDGWRGQHDVAQRTETDEENVFNGVVHSKLTENQKPSFSEKLGF